MKKFFIGFLNLLLSVLIFLLLFSFYGKTIFSGFITDFLGGLKSNVTDTIFVEKNNNDDSSVKVERNFTMEELFESPEYKALLENKEVQELIDKYVDSAISGVADPDSLNNVDLGEDIINFIIENKEVLEKEYNITISDEDISSMRESEEFNSLTDDFIENIKTASEELSNTQKKLIKAYNFVCGTGFKIVLFILIILDIVLISILQKSLIKWIKTIGANLLSSGILTIILGLVLHFSINSIVKKLDINLQFDFLKISLIGLIASIIGVIFIVVYHFVKKKENSDNILDSYDEVTKDANLGNLYEEVSKGEDEEYHEYDEEINNFSDDDI